MFAHCWRVVLLLATLSQPLYAATDIVVRYPSPESGPDARSRYNLRLLALVLERADRAYRVDVYGTSNYASLFHMLENERLDYFPRSVTEIWAELDVFQSRLMVEPGIVLRYPTAIYFFVRKGNTQLAADITAGLEKMIADGAFEKLFQQYHGEMIAKSGLRERRILDLKNPLVPARMPLERKSFWFRVM
jgi:hypothetical protein